MYYSCGIYLWTIFFLLFSVICLGIINFDRVPWIYLNAVMLYFNKIVPWLILEDKDGPQESYWGFTRSWHETCSFRFYPYTYSRILASRPWFFSFRTIFVWFVAKVFSVHPGSSLLEGHLPYYDLLHTVQRLPFLLRCWIP